MFSVLGGSKRTSNDKPFRGGEITSLIGGTQLDLRQATIEPGQQAVINVFVMMGGHEMWVPSGMDGGSRSCRFSAVSRTSGCRRSTRHRERRTKRAPRLVLRGVVVMGGLTIKN